MIQHTFRFTACLILIGISYVQCSVSKKKSANAASRQATAAAPMAKDPISGKESSNAQSIQGSWQFDNFTMVNTSKTILFPMEVPMLYFDVKGKKFSGTGGCNNISGSFVLNGNELTFTQPFIMTRMSCNAMGEKIFVNYLNSVQRFLIEGNSLQLITDSKPAIVLKRVMK